MGQALTAHLSRDVILAKGADLRARALYRLWQKRPEVFYHFAHDILYSPKPMALKNVAKEFLAKGSRQTLFVPETGGHVVTYRYGSGPAIILVHGWAARGAQLSKFVEPLVAKGHSVVLFDQPAHGESSLRATNIFQFSYSLKRVIEEERDVAGLVGHSMGCSAIAANLGWFPWIDKVVLMAPHFDLRSDMLGWITKRGIAPEMVEGLIDWLEIRYELKFEKINLYEVAKTIESDVLLIHDEDDDATIFQNSKELLALLPASELFSTQGLGHFRLVRDPRVVDRVAQAFATKT